MFLLVAMATELAIIVQNDSCVEIWIFLLFKIQGSWLTKFTDLLVVEQFSMSVH